MSSRFVMESQLMSGLNDGNVEKSCCIDTKHIANWQILAIKITVGTTFVRNPTLYMSLSYFISLSLYQLYV